MVDVVEILVPTSPTVVEVLIPWEPVVLPVIALSGSSVIESAVPGTFVGTLSVVNATGTPTFTLPDTAGGKFGISGTSLVTAGAFDYAIATSHSVVVAAAGVSPNPGNRTFVITVVDVPKQIVLSNNTVPEDLAPGSVIGTLSVVDGDGTYTFTVIADPDNLFTVDSDDLDKGGILDYETSTAHEVTIQADNGAGDVLTQIFTIHVTDVLDTTEPPASTGITNTMTVGRGNYITQTVARQYITPFGTYVNEEL